ncbi:hypothetical protein [Neisseria sp. CCUG12390]|uniref:hypothetical protein n=1 Tax=Neisseria sp. CCUG12390 TaxID=3392035 RepID=UPI003A0FC147
MLIESEFGALQCVEFENGLGRLKKIQSQYLGDDCIKIFSERQKAENITQQAVSFIKVGISSRLTSQR